MTNGKLIVVTGPAAVGKSTVAKGLQAEFANRGELWLVMELDQFGRGLPRDWVSVGSHDGRYSLHGFSYQRAHDNSIDLVLGSDGRRVLKAFHRSIAAVASAGTNVICETIVYDEDDWSDWLEAVVGISTTWVRLSASLAILEEREKADRSRVFQGLARGMSARSVVGTFDIEADTSNEEASAIVSRIAG